MPKHASALSTASAWRYEWNGELRAGQIFKTWEALEVRQTAVRNLVRAGVPEKTAMPLTGHKTRAVFDRYDIVDESDLRVAATRLNTLMGTTFGHNEASRPCNRDSHREIPSDGPLAQW